MESIAALTPLSGPELDARLKAWSDDIDRVAELYREHAKEKGSWLEQPGDRLVIGHRPDNGRYAYDIVHFPPLTAAQIQLYQTRRSVVIPGSFASLLTQMNGAAILQLHIFGIPESMATEVALLDRSQRNPFDVGTANKYWRAEYDAPDSDFHFLDHDTSARGINSDISCARTGVSSPAQKIARICRTFAPSGPTSRIGFAMSRLRCNRTLQYSKKTSPGGGLNTPPSEGRSPISFARP